MRAGRRALGVGVLALAVLHLILFDAWIGPVGYMPVLNGRFVTMAFVVVAFYAAGLIYWLYRKPKGNFRLSNGLYRPCWGWRIW